MTSEQAAYQDFIREMGRNAMLSEKYKDHLIQLMLFAVHDAFKRGVKSVRKTQKRTTT